MVHTFTEHAGSHSYEVQTPARRIHTQSSQSPWPAKDNSPVKNSVSADFCSIFGVVMKILFLLLFGSSFVAPLHYILTRST